MTHWDAKLAVAEGHIVGRESEDCRIIRQGDEGDRDYINYDPAGMIVEDCKKRVCDCKIIIYRETEADKLATDWRILTPEEVK